MADNLYKATVKWAGDEFFIGTGYTGHAQVMDSKGDRNAATSPVEMLLGCGCRLYGDGCDLDLVKETPGRDRI